MWGKVSDRVAIDAMTSDYDELEEERKRGGRYADFGTTTTLILPVTLVASLMSTVW